MSFEDHDDDRMIQVRSTWQAIDTVEIPDHVNASEARDLVRDGQFPEWLAEQLDAGGASLTDWELA